MKVFIHNNNMSKYAALATHHTEHKKILIVESARTHEFSINVALSVYLFEMARRKNIVGWNEMRHEKQHRGRRTNRKKKKTESFRFDCRVAVGVGTIIRRWRKLNIWIFQIQPHRSICTQDQRTLPRNRNGKHWTVTQWNRDILVSRIDIVSALDE